MPCSVRLPSLAAHCDVETHCPTGFSFSGEVREPFPAVIRALEDTQLPVTSVDAPSSWDIEAGPPETGLGSKFMPEVLISLSAPKPLVKFFSGRHFVGGRLVDPSKSFACGVSADVPIDSSPLALPKGTTSQSPTIKAPTNMPRCQSTSASCDASLVSRCSNVAAVRLGLAG